MNEQMQDHIEKLDKVDGMLAMADRALAYNKNEMMEFERDKLRNARQILQLTTDLLRQDYAQMARARDAAIGMLTYLRDEHLAQPYCIDSRDQLAPRPEQYRLSLPDRNRITQIIALLDGSAKEEADVRDSE